MGNSVCKLHYGLLILRSLYPNNCKVALSVLLTHHVVPVGVIGSSIVVPTWKQLAETS